VRVEGREIELFYDFEEQAQLGDFEAAMPFRAVRTIKFVHEAGRIHVSGTGSMRHKAVFKEKVRVSAEFRPVKNRDFGFAISEAHESEVFTLYCVYDKFFGATDGVLTHQNMIIKFIPRDPKINKEGWQDWRYCGSRGPKPRIKRGVPYEVIAERSENRSFLQIGKWTSKGKEAGRDLTSQMVSVYGHKGDVRVDNLRIIGTLDPAFIAAHRLDMTERKPPKAKSEATDTPAEPEIAPDAADRIRTQIDGYPARTKPLSMARILRDPEVPSALRKEAADKAVGAGKKQLVPYLLDGMSSKDASARRFSFEVFKALVGKAMSYRPDGPEAGRSAAMKKINKYVQKNARDFQ